MGFNERFRGPNPAAVEKAHVIGGSLGGFIAQILAASHSDRILSLTLVSSSNGNPELPQGKVYAAMEPPPAGNAEMIEYQLKLAKALASPGYPTDEETMRRNITAEMERPNYPAGIARQGVAYPPTATCDRWISTSSLRRQLFTERMIQFSPLHMRTTSQPIFRMPGSLLYPAWDTSFPTLLPRLSQAKFLTSLSKTSASADRSTRHGLQKPRQKWTRCQPNCPRHDELRLEN
ncbi:alpha/beta fold hydrolase [Rhizobium mongolense]|uniref:alpha/beta fold hydrolase n=1 Tax=Rhizobium mongolense TaxID=57676 RepID=UPI001FEDD70C|nr:alpha/beta fold hydrolase [Rhizobium mongolense]